MARRPTYRADTLPGDLVLVHGAGPIGLIVCDIAHTRGATVIVSEVNEKRLGMAPCFGAKYTVNPMKEDLGARVMEISGGEGANVIFEGLRRSPSLPNSRSGCFLPAGGLSDDLWRAANSCKFHAGQQE